jgi:hypothetical protein
MAGTDPTEPAAGREADPADVAEQHASVREDDEALARAELEQLRRRSPEASEADVAEQAVEVVDDDEERR